MFGSLIVSGIGLLLTNPIRRALAGKPKRKAKRKAKGYWSPPLKSMGAEGWRCTGRNPKRKQTLAGFSAEVVSALAWQGRTPRIPKTAMPMVRSAFAQGGDPGMVAEDIAAGKRKTYANPSKAKRRASKRKSRGNRISKRIIREVISDEGRSRYSRRHRVLRARMYRRGVSLGHIMYFNDKHRRNPLRRGKSKAAISANISRLMHEGRPQRQAIAIAMRTAGMSRRNPPRDPHFVGTFDAPAYPLKHKSFTDGDTAAVESPHKPGTYEIWVFGMVDPRAGDSWNYVSGKLTRAKAISEAQRLAKI